MNALLPVIASPAVLVLSVAATAAVLGMLRRRRVLDRPNPRSSHSEPTPRGGGIAVVGVLVLAWGALALAEGNAGPVWVLAGMVVLAAVSWIDDLRGLPPLPRLLVQGAAVAAVMAFAGGPGLVFQGLLPPLADRAAAAVLWLWFVNVYNFMDGIDGLAGSETVCLGLGLWGLSAFFGLDPAVGGPALLVAAAAAGFLVFNWHPARLFLGDVGSVPLGFAVGWLLLAAAARGEWAAALILPLYYLADATLTVVRRGLRGAPVWRAHREHFYQAAVGRGRAHHTVVLVIVGANALLMALAFVAAAGRPGPALAGAVVVVALLLAYLGRGRACGARRAAAR